MPIYSVDESSVVAVFGAGDIAIETGVIEHLGDPPIPAIVARFRSGPPGDVGRELETDRNKDEFGPAAISLVFPQVEAAEVLIEMLQAARDQFKAMPAHATVSPD